MPSASAISRLHHIGNPSVLAPVAFSGSSLTHKLAGIPHSAIDFFLMSGDRLEIRNARVLRDYDFSDHFPIVVDVVDSPWSVSDLCAPRRRTNMRKLLESSASIRDNTNYWAPLEALIQSCSTSSSPSEAASTESCRRLLLLFFPPRVQSSTRWPPLPPHPYPSADNRPSPKVPSS